MRLFLSILYCIQYILNLHFVVYARYCKIRWWYCLKYLLMFRICISWATTRSKEGWIIFHIKAGINNKYLNQATDSWLRIPGEVSDLIYAAHCFTDWKYLNLNTVQRIVTSNQPPASVRWLLNHLFPAPMWQCVPLFPHPHYLLISQVLYRYLIPYIVSTAQTMPQIGSMDMELWSKTFIFKYKTLINLTDSLIRWWWWW